MGSENTNYPSAVRDELKELSAENQRLRREIGLLKREIDELRGTSIFKRGHGYGNHTFDRQASYEEMYSRKSFSSSVFVRAKQTSLFKLYRRLLNFIRRYTFITTTIKIASFLFALIETSALLLLSTSVLVVSIPLSIIISHITVFLSLFSIKRHNRNNKTVIEGKDVIVLFPPKERAFESGSYFRFMVDDFAKSPDKTVVIVSPSPIKAMGISSKKPYLLSRAEGDNIIIVRKHYYFTLRNKIINKHAKSVTQIF